MLTAEERALLPAVIAIWEKRLAKPVELTELDRINAQIAIYEAQRMLDQARECPTCLKIALTGFGPSHNGSACCKSGSIASGGAHAHCACDTCF